MKGLDQSCAMCESSKNADNQETPFQGHLLSVWTRASLSQSAVVFRSVLHAFLHALTATRRSSSVFTDRIARPRPALALISSPWFAAFQTGCRVRAEMSYLRIWLLRVLESFLLPGQSVQSIHAGCSLDGMCCSEGTMFYPNDDPCERSSGSCVRWNSICLMT